MIFVCGFIGLSAFAPLLNDATITPPAFIAEAFISLGGLADSCAHVRLSFKLFLSSFIFPLRTICYRFDWQVSVQL